MKTTKGYPLNEGNFKSLEKIQSKIDFFVEDPTLFDLLEYVTEESEDLVREIDSFNTLVKSRVGSIEKGYKEIGFKAKIKFKDGLKNTIKWIDEVTSE